MKVKMWEVTFNCNCLKERTVVAPDAVSAIPKAVKSFGDATITETDVTKVELIGEED